MELEVSYDLETEQQFWDELNEIVSRQCQEHELIDDALRTYLSFISRYRGEYIQSEYDFARCSFRLLQSPLFTGHKDYVRLQIIYSLLQEDSPQLLHLITNFLLSDGRQNEGTYEMMNEEGVFPRLVELIQEKKDDDAGLHRLLFELCYEMARIQRLRIEDLVLIDDDFITSMFQIVETLSDDVNDPYLYPVIRVLLVLNEQYMVSAHDPTPEQSKSTASRLTNKVVKILATYGSAYKSFGQNIILLLNREEETSLQLLILKLLYLLFTSPPTYEYFYTNDLHVLVDIILRNLLDLPQSADALRHTYLRVLYPLLAHTQLKSPPHYKREDVLRLLTIMGGSSSSHFEAVDDTTQRLVTRCTKVEWILGGQNGVEEGEGAVERVRQTSHHHITITTTMVDTIGAASQKNEEDQSPGFLPELTSSQAGQLKVAAMPAAMASSSSVVEVASQRSKPGVITPRRSRRPAVPIPVKKSGDTGGGKGAGLACGPTQTRSVSVSAAPPPVPHKYHGRRLQSLGSKDALEKATAQAANAVVKESTVQVEGEA